VIDGSTGYLARLDDVDAFIAAINKIDTLDFDPLVARQNAERFSVQTFQRRLSEQISAAAQVRSSPRAA
jgi:glycosyltransferase involved in cell wall biosynthesis